jgi:hypothetical protein
MVQEGHLLFWKLTRKYEGRIQNQRHFMGLFGRSFHNRLHRLAMECKVGAKKAWWVRTEEGESELGDLTPARSYANVLEAHRLLDDAPAPIQRLIQALGISDELEATRALVLNREGARRETRLDWLRRVMELPEGVCPRTMILRWLKGEPTHATENPLHV